mgnify:CR=1 FL=1
MLPWYPSTVNDHEVVVQLYVSPMAKWSAKHWMLSTLMSNWSCGYPFTATKAKLDTVMLVAAAARPAKRTGVAYFMFDGRAGGLVCSEGGEVGFVRLER